MAQSTVVLAHLSNGGSDFCTGSIVVSGDRPADYDRFSESAAFPRQQYLHSDSSALSELQT
jgi:hypothetical protein